jgi:sRNA-binding regulator protein Hfq
MAPPEQTNAEAFYYLKQMQARTPIVVKLLDGEEIRGWIEWYDKDVLKVNREGAPNLLIPKHAIKYLYKQEEERQLRRRERMERRNRPPAGPETPSTE